MGESLRIALVTELFHPRIAGCERRFFEIGKRLSQRGHEIHVFTLRYDANLPQEEAIEKMLIHRYAGSGNYISHRGYRSFGGVFQYAFGTFRKLLGQDFDIYYCNQWPVFHSFFAKPLASPIIQEWCEVWTGAKMMVLQKLLKFVGDHHVAVSEFTRRRLVNLLGIEPERISVVPNGVNYRRFSKDSHEKKWGRIIYVGRLVPHKNVEMLIDAFRIVKEKVPEAELHVVGSGYLLSLIERQASNLDDCFIHGFLPDNQMFRLLKTSWLSVLLSEREGSGISCLEAMSAGVPVITADYPDNAAKDTVACGGGITVQPTSSAVASAILNVLFDESLWKKMSRKAKEFAAHYDWDVIADLAESRLKYWSS